MREWGVEGEGDEGVGCRESVHIARWGNVVRCRICCVRHLRLLLACSGGLGSTRG